MSETNFNPLVDVSARRSMPKIIAHRGANRLAPENTLPAIQKAIELGVDGVEFDVLLTSDGVPVITHNDDLSILTHHRGYAHSTPFATLSSLDAGVHFSAAFAETKIPTLAEMLELISTHEVMSIVEIKTQPGLAASAAQIVGDIISDFRMSGPVVISTSSIRTANELAKRHRDLCRALIIKRPSLAFFLPHLLARISDSKGVHASLKVLSRGLVNGMHKRNKEVFAWTANGAEDVDLCLSMGVDGIITDDAEFAFTRLTETFGLSRR
jgi:glycerophosphoryl diester phosphodiesterase